MWFEASLRLRINLEKSKLIPMRRVENLEDWALESGCKVGALPSSYLGHPLGVPFKYGSMGWSIGEVLQKNNYEENTTHLQMWKASPDSKHFI